MVRDLRIKDYTFSVGSLTADTDGLFNVYSDYSLNGTIQNISFGSNTYTNTGSFLFYVSGTDNVAQKDLILRMRVGSMMTTIYPRTYTFDNQQIIGSATSDNARENFIINSPLRLVGSGLGNATSGLYVTIRYI